MKNANLVWNAACYKGGQNMVLRVILRMRITPLRYIHKYNSVTVTLIYNYTKSHQMGQTADIKYYNYCFIPSIPPPTHSFGSSPTGECMLC